MAAEMGLSEEQFFDTTPRHFNRLRIAWLENRPALEAARFVSFHVLRSVGAKVRRFEQVVRFPWDVTVRRVQLEDWNNPAMLKFSEEADRALAILNPKVYEEYMAGKAAREKQAEQNTQAADDPEMKIEFDLDL